LTDSGKDKRGDGTYYSNKVLEQMSRGAGEFHSFPESITAFEKSGIVERMFDVNGNPFQRLRIPGSYLSSHGNWYTGEFRFIKSSDGDITERLFIPGD
jgi:hypothetical protein